MHKERVRVAGGVAMITFFSSILVLVSTLIPSAATAREIRVTYTFTDPVVESDRGGFTTISFENTRQSGKVGEPSYPYQGVRVLLPPGEMPVSVRFERGGWKRLPSGLILRPKQRPVPGFERGDQAGPLLISSAAYAIDEWVFPPESTLQVHYLRGHAIGTGTFTPLAYHPSGKESGFHSEITLVIETAPSSTTRRIASDPRYDAKTLSALRSMVDNPGELPLMSFSTTPSTPLQYKYMIVTSEDLESSFAPLCDFYNRRGLKTRIMTTEEIDERFAGMDLCEKIRTAITQNYSDFGVEYVLLGGDVEIVPYRGFTCTVDSDNELPPGDGSPATIRVDNRIPSDIYFSNLDGDWNDNRDILWGEPGEEDLYSEVSVGRACVNTPAEASKFIHKTTMYQEAPVTGHLRRVLLLGEELNNDPQTWGGDDLDQLIDTCQAHDFSTTGVPPDFDILKYYDREINSWDGMDVVAGEVNNGTHWVFHDGHCNIFYGMRLSVGAITNGSFTNDGVAQNYPVINTIGCLLGAFEVDDCIAERIVGIDNFASAMICNSRYGWYAPGSTNGVSHHYQREFVDAIFGDGLTRLGPAHARSKDDTAIYLTLPGHAEAGVMRWCFYCLNLLGDPAADTWTDTPAPIEPVHSGAIALMDVSYSVSTGVPGCTGALSWNGQLYTTATADMSGEIVFDLAGSIPADRDSLILCVNAHDCLPCSETVTIHQLSGTDDLPVATALLGCVPNPFNPSTTISFTIERQGRVDMAVYDAAGRLIDVLADGEMDPGPYDLVWSPSNVSSGVYFCVLRTADVSRTIKLVLMR